MADAAKAKKFFTSLLEEQPYIDQPHYVGYKSGEVEIGLDPHGHQRGAGAVAFWTVANIEESLERLSAAGSETVQDIKDVGTGRLVAIVKDPDGTLIGLQQPPAA